MDRYLIVYQTAANRIVQVLRNNDTIIRNIPDAQREEYAVFAENLEWMRDALQNVKEADTDLLDALINSLAEES